MTNGTSDLCVCMVPLGGSASSGGFVTVDGFQKDFAAWAKNHPEGTQFDIILGRVFRLDACLRRLDHPNLRETAKLLGSS